MSFLLGCECGQGIRVSAAQAGTTARCPACSREVPVPSLGELRRLSLAPTVRRDKADPGHAMASPRIAGVALIAIGFALPCFRGLLVPNFDNAGQFEALLVALAGSVFWIAGALLVTISKGYPILVCLLIALLCPPLALIVLLFPDHEPRV